MSDASDPTPRAPSARPAPPEAAGPPARPAPPRALSRRTLRGPTLALSVLSEAIHGLLGHPLRSVLTGLSVTFGAAVLVILVAYASGVPDITADILRSMGGKEFLVEAGRSRGGGGSRGGRRLQIRYVDIPAIAEACPSVDGLAPAYRPGRGGPAFSHDRSWPWVNLTGVGHEYRAVTDLRIVAGRWFTEGEEDGSEEVALISRPLMDGMYDGRLPLGEPLEFGARRYRIIGVFESEASFAYSVFVPYTTSMELGDGGGRNVSSLAFAPRRPDLAKAAISEMRQALGTLYSFDPSDERAIDIRENTAFVSQVEAVSLGLEALVLTIAVLALVLGCLGAANVVGIAVAERTAELGLRKALGADVARVRAEVLAETLLLCLTGGALGVGLALTVVSWLGELPFTDDARLVPALEAGPMTVALLLLVFTATAAGLPAANRAARLDPVDALRQE